MSKEVFQKQKRMGITLTCILLSADLQTLPWNSHTLAL